MIRVRDPLRSMFVYIVKRVIVVVIAVGVYYLLASSAVDYAVVLVNELGPDDTSTFAFDVLAYALVALVSATPPAVLIVLTCRVRPWVVATTAGVATAALAAFLQVQSFGSVAPNVGQLLMRHVVFDLILAVVLPLWAWCILRMLLSRARGLVT